MNEDGHTTPEAILTNHYRDYHIWTKVEIKNTLDNSLGLCKGHPNHLTTGMFPFLLICVSIEVPIELDIGLVVVQD